MKTLVLRVSNIMGNSYSAAITCSYTKMYLITVDGNSAVLCVFYGSAMVLWLCSVLLCYGSAMVCYAVLFCYLPLCAMFCYRTEIPHYQFLISTFTETFILSGLSLT